MPLSAEEIILQYVCPAFGMIAANIMFAGKKKIVMYSLVFIYVSFVTTCGIHAHLVFCFTAPFNDVRQAVSRGTLGHLNPTPWAAMTGNCCGWVTYSYLIQVCACAIIMLLNSKHKL